jgi:hypothetical protein
VLVVVLLPLFLLSFYYRPRDKGLMRYGAADIFGGPHFGTVSGLLLTGMGGYIHDASGTYVPAFTLCSVCIGLSCLTFRIAAPRKGAKARR